MNIPIVSLIAVAIRQYTNNAYITSKRLVTRTGLLSRQSNEILLPKIETVSVTQGALERLLDCGDVQLTGTGKKKDLWDFQEVKSNCPRGSFNLTAINCHRAQMQLFVEYHSLCCFQ
jgi:uncharacterized membrane protein YdbT with pleckstrin-like domain